MIPVEFTCAQGQVARVKAGERVRLLVRNAESTGLVTVVAS